MPTGPSLSQPSPTVAAGDIGDEVRVVVVDDSAVIRRVLAGVIKQAAGVTLVGQAINGREALTVIETEHPDVVVLDVEMPVLDGLGALREAKRRWPGLPIVMFSTLTEAGAAATLKALSEGADDYLTKPISTNGPVGAFDAVREQLVPLLVAWGEIGRQRAARRGRGARATTPRTARWRRDLPHLVAPARPRRYWRRRQLGRCPPRQRSRRRKCRSWSRDAHRCCQRRDCSGRRPRSRYRVPVRPHPTDPP